MEIIKELRRKNGINQTALASALNVSLRTIQLYEKKDANIPIKNLHKIADFFEMSIGELYIHEVNETEGYYSVIQPITGGINFGYRLDNGKTLLKVPVIFSESQEEFVTKFNDKAFLKKQLKVDFLIRAIDDDADLAFEITGYAMENNSSQSIPNGSLVLGRKVNKRKLDTDEKFAQRIFVIVCSNRLICKCITGISENQKAIICHNLNPSPEYRDFQIPINEINAIYEVIKKQV